METLVVRSSFWLSPIVQHLRSVCPDEVMFRESENILVDLLFPFSSQLSFAIFYPERMNEQGVEEIKEMLKSRKFLVVVACAGPENADLYAEFLSAVPPALSCVICLPPANFARKAAESIWKAASETKISSRRLDKMIENRRREFMNPDVQAPAIFGALIKDVEERSALQKIMNTETGTIRNTLIKGIPEILERDFYISEEE